MKKLLSIILTFAMLLTFIAVPATVSAEGEATGPVTSYKWDFSEDALWTDYSAGQPHPEGLKAVVSTFDPFLNGMDGNNYNYKIEHATIGGKDAMRIRYSGSEYRAAFVPLMSDGKGFVVEAGKTYSMKVTAVFKSNANEKSYGDYYSGSGFGLAPCTNLRGNGWNTNTNPLSYTTSKYGSYGNKSFRSLYNMVDIYTAKGSAIGGTSYSTYNSAGAANSAVFYVNENGKSATFNTQFTLPAHEYGAGNIILNKISGAGDIYNEEGVGCYQYFGAYNSGYTPQNTHTYYNNYFAFELPACKDVYVKGDLADALDKTEIGGELYSHAYVDMYITELEIFEYKEDAVLTYDFGNGTTEQVSFAGADIAINKVPAAPEGKVFAGWYADASFSGEALSTVAFEAKDKTVYAKFIDKATTYSNTFDEAVHNDPTYYWLDADGNYHTYIESTPLFGTKSAELGGIAYTADEGSVLFSTANQYGYAGGFVFANPDGTAFIPEVGTEYKITVSARLSSKSQSANWAFVEMSVGANKTFAQAANGGNASSWFSKKSQATKIDTITNEYNDYVFSFVASAPAEGQVPCMGMYIMVGDQTPGVAYNVLQIADIKVEKVNTATFVIGEGATIEDFYGIYENGVYTYYYTGDLTAPEVTYANGNKVLGWYTDANFANEATSFVAGGTYYAKTGEMVTITLNRDGVTEELTGLKGDAVVLPDTGIVDKNWYSNERAYTRDIVAPAVFESNITLYSSAASLSRKTTNKNYGFSFSDADVEKDGDTVDALLYETKTPDEYTAITNDDVSNNPLGNMKYIYNRADYNAYQVGRVADGVTYKLTFNYKATEMNTDIGINVFTAFDASVKTAVSYVDGSVNSRYYVIKKDDTAIGEWQTATIYFTTSIRNIMGSETLANDTVSEGYDTLYFSFLQDYNDVDLATTKNSLYITDVAVTELVDALANGGASKLTAEDAAEIEEQAIRYFFSYETEDGSTIKIDGKEFKVYERGFIFRNGAKDKYCDVSGGLYTSKDFTISSNPSEVVRLYKDSKFNECWKYDSGRMTFSTHVEGFDVEGDARKLMVKGYICFGDGENFFMIYSSISNRCVDGVDVAE